MVWGRKRRVRRRARAFLCSAHDITLQSYARELVEALRHAAGPKQPCKSKGGGEPRGSSTTSALALGLAHSTLDDANQLASPSLPYPLFTNHPASTASYPAHTSHHAQRRQNRQRAFCRLSPPAPPHHRPPLACSARPFLAPLVASSDSPNGASPTSLPDSAPYPAQSYYLLCRHEDQSCSSAARLD